MIFRFTFALWWDPHWRASFRKSWKRRRYWLARPEAGSPRGRTLALQFGPLTLKFKVEGHNG